MSKDYNPFDWYWRSANGRVFSSARGMVVPADDTVFSTWMEDGTQPTVWPRDDADQQTNAELYAVLAPYGVKIDGYTPVPASVSSAQAKIQLARTPGSADGKTLLDDVTDAAKGAGIEAQIWFTEARTWERNNPYVASLSKGLKLKTADVDQLFISAAQIAA